MGPRSAGKSHFIDLVVSGQSDQRDQRLQRPSSLLVKATRFTHPKHGSQVVLVELPGFGRIPEHMRRQSDSTWSDVDALQVIGTWLHKMYAKGTYLTGIIYAQRISDGLGSPDSQKNIQILHNICGDRALKKKLSIVLMSTMWENVEPKLGGAKEKEIRSKLWRKLIDQGAKVSRLGAHKEDALNVVDKAIPKHSKRGPLLFQEELDNPLMQLKSSTAGRTLFIALEKFISDLEQTFQSKILLIQALDDRAHIKQLEQQQKEIKWDIRQARSNLARLEARNSTWTIDDPYVIVTNPLPPQPTSPLNLMTSIDAVKGFLDGRAPSTSSKEPVDSFSDTENLRPSIYGFICTLLLDIAKEDSKRMAIADLRGDSAQSIADFLSQVLDDVGTLKADERKLVLSLLSKLAKSAQVFPACYELGGVVYSLNHPVNEGGYGCIYKGTYRGKDICIKAVRMYERQSSTLVRRIQAQAKEFILWAQLSHQNILPFYGVFQSEEIKPRICIVSPWMSNGDLGSYLAASPGTPQIPLMGDVVAGLRYLHESKIVHGDLKAKNILISDDKRAMIADFGISSIAMTIPISSAEAGGTLNWMAPELVTSEDLGKTPITPECDIWSFGCVCFEISTGEIPFSQYKGYQLMHAFMKSDGSMNPLTAFLASEEDGARPPEGLSIGSVLRSLMEMCWEHQPAMRPTCVMIQGVITRLRVPDNRPPVVSDTIPSATSIRPSVEIDYKRVYDTLTQIQRGSYVNEDDR